MRIHKVAEEKKHKYLETIINQIQEDKTLRTFRCHYQTARLQDHLTQSSVFMGSSLLNESRASFSSLYSDIITEQSSGEENEECLKKGQGSNVVLTLTTETLALSRTNFCALNVTIHNQVSL